MRGSVVLVARPRGFGLLRGVTGLAMRLVRLSMFLILGTLVLAAVVLFSFLGTIGLLAWLLVDRFRSRR